MTKSRIVLAAFSLAALLCSHVCASSPTEILRERTRCEVQEVPLKEVVASLSELHGISIVLTKDVDGDEWITFDGEAELGVVLTQMLNPLKLKHRAEGNRLTISPTDAVAYAARIREKAENDKKARQLEQQAGKQLTGIGGQAFRARGWIRLVVLRGENISDAKLAPLEHLQHLDHLRLSGCPITDEGLVHLNSLGQLLTLGLSDTKITDAGLAHLKNLLQLKYLDLSNTKVTDAGLVHLQGLARLRVVLVKNTAVTELGADKLRGANKDIRVFFEPDDERLPKDPFAGRFDDPVGQR